MEKALNLNQSIIKIRVELQKSKIKKSGKNKFAGFDYYELADFLPKLNELMLKEDVNDIFTIKDNIAILTLIKGEEKQDYQIPFVLFDTPMNFKKNEKTGEIREVKSMQDIQYLGALNTYYKRYLYLNAFGITDGEVIDALDNDENTSPNKKEVPKATPNQVAVLSKIYTGENLQKLLDSNKISNLEELTIYKASELIQKLKEKKEEEK